MKRYNLNLLLIILSIICLAKTGIYADTLNVIIIKAHPDEAEEYAGGTAALLIRAGHHVKFLSLTNGDVGHWNMTKEQIALRRLNEAKEVEKRIGVTYQILPYHDGELENNVELRKQVVKAIREWNADVVISFKPMFGGGHPDNMASAIAVQQGAGLSSAPLFMPEVPFLKKRPLFLHMRDYYSKSFPHTPDYVIPIDSVINIKLYLFDAHASQFYEFAPYQRGILNEVPKSWEDKKVFLHKYWDEFSIISSEMRTWLINWFGGEIASKFNYAEEFELAPYSRKPTENEILNLFPVLRK